MHLQEFLKEDLIEMFWKAYKNTRVFAMDADLTSSKLRRMEQIVLETKLLPSVDRPPSNFPEEC